MGASENVIFPNFEVEAIVVVRRNNSKFRAEKGSIELIKSATKELIDWAKSIDPEAEIQNHAQDLNGKIMKSWDHITALAYLGQTGKLEDYRLALSTDQNTLHPLIEDEHLSRAIELSERLLKGPNKLEILRGTNAVNA